MRSKLEDHRDQVYLSQKLATIIRDVPLEFSLEAAAWEFDRDMVRSKFEELEFGRSLATRVG